MHTPNPKKSSLYLTLVGITTILSLIGIILYLLFIISEFDYKQKLIDTGGTYVEHGGFVENCEDRHQVFKLYFLGFKRRWFLNGLKPIRIRSMVLGYFDKDNKPRLIYGAGPSKYGRFELIVDYFLPDGRRKIYKDQEKVVEKLQDFNGEFIGIAFYSKKPTTNVSAGLINKEMEGWQNYLSNFEIKIVNFILKKLKQNEYVILNYFYALPVFYVNTNI